MKSSLNVGCPPQSAGAPGGRGSRRARAVRRPVEGRRARPAWPGSLGNVWAADAVVTGEASAVPWGRSRRPPASPQGRGPEGRWPMRAADSPGGCVGNGVEAGGPWTERDRPEAVTDVQARSEETWTELSSEHGAGRGRRRASWAHRRRATRRTWTGRWAAGRRAPLASPGRETALGLVTGRRVSARHASGSSQRLCGPALWRQDKDPGTVLLGVLPTPDGFQVCSLNSLSGNDSFLPGQREPATSVPPWSLHWHGPGSRGGAGPLTPPALPLPRSCVWPVRPRLGLLVHVLGQLGQLRPQGRAPQPCGGLGKCPAREPRPRPDSVRGLGPARGGPRKRPRR